MVMANQTPLAWPERFLDAHLDEVAVSTVPLILHPRTWIDRRREYVEFIDEQTLRREVRIDLTVPEQRQRLTLSSGKSIFYAPIALIAKGSLRQLRVDDGSGAELAPVNSRHAERVARRMLVLAARGLIRGALAPALQARLEDIAGAEPDRGLELLTAVQELEGEAGDQALALLTQSRFKILVGEFAQSALFLLALADRDPHERVCVRYTYEGPLSPDPGRPSDGSRPRARGRRERVAESLGWSAVDLSFDAPALGSALSCEFDMKAPEDLRIESARIVRRGDDRELDRDPRPTRIAHVRVHDCPRGTDGTVSVALRLRSGGFLGSSVIAAMLTTGVLVLGTARATQVAVAGESAAALLVGLPALLAGYLVRPGEHRLVGRVVNGIRLLLVVLVLMCIVAIGTLIAGMGESAREVAWAVMAAVAAGIFVVTLAAWWRAHKLERWSIRS